jgi:hypothetical protein
LLGSEDTPAPDIAPDGATEATSDTPLILPMPQGLPVSRATPIPSPKTPQQEVALEPPSDAKPAAEELDNRLLHTLGTAGLLVAIWLPQRRMLRHTKASIKK